ncbi:MAG: shikimate kinase [Chlamydiia bacterium]|nr:shikimate kinase [Chlamydiia bacterium]
MNIILFGFKGSGKTHLGKRLARMLKRPFIDTDDLICMLYPQQGLSCRQIYTQVGESVFRALEKQALHQLNASSHAVIALGGGAVLCPENVLYLQKIGTLVYLKVSFETVKKRIFRRGAPSFVDADNPEGSLYQIYCERLQVYESIPARCIDVDLLAEGKCLAELRLIALSEEPHHGH